MIRVGLLTPGLILGGAERWVAMLASQLPNPCVVSGVACRDEGQVLDSFRKLIPSPIYEGHQSFAMLASKSDILVGWGHLPLGSVKSFSGPVVIVSHGCCEWTKKAISQCLPYVTHCAAVSRNAAKVFEGQEEITVIHNGIDTSRCEPTVSRTESRKRLGIKDGEIAIGHVGRISADKNPLACVRASVVLGEKYRPVICGGGPASELFIQEAKKLRPDVVCCSAVEHVGDIYSALDCFVLATPMEGMSLSLTEAWYCSCPTVSTPVGATELYDIHGPLSVTVPVNCSDEILAAGILEAISLKNMPTIQRATSVVRQHYTSTHMCSRWAEFLQKVIAGEVRRYEHRPIGIAKTPCQCERPGWCERHGINKSPHLHMLCRNNQSYFDAWEAGIGPGQNIDPNARSQQIPKTGVGWELVRVLDRFGIRSRGKGCGCSDKLGFMNKWGVDACVARIPTIVAWLAKEAKAQQQPFCERKARTLVRLAIRNTRLALENSPAERASCANNP